MWWLLRQQLARRSPSTLFVGPAFASRGYAKPLPEFHLAPPFALLSFLRAAGVRKRRTWYSAAVEPRNLAWHVSRLPHTPSFFAAKSFYIRLWSFEHPAHSARFAIQSHLLSSQTHTPASHATAVAASMLLSCRLVLLPMATHCQLASNGRRPPSPWQPYARSRACAGE
jgi:hypothetical protein